MKYPILSVFVLALIPLVSLPVVSAEMLLTKDSCLAEANRVHMMIAGSAQSSEDQDRFMADQIDAKAKCSSGDFEGALSELDSIREDFEGPQG